MRASGAKWNQGLLLLTTGGPALISLLSSFVAIRYLGIADFGQWLSWRSLFLLLAIPTPGFNIAQQVLVAEANAAGDTSRAYRVQRYCDTRSLAWVGVTSVMILAVYVALGASWDRSFAVVLLYSGLFWGAYTTSLIIGNKDAVRTVRGSYADVGGGLATIAAALTGSLELYVATMGLRYWIKGALQYAPIPEKGLRLDAPTTQQINHDTRRVGVPLMLRAFVRDASQYGDKPILSGLFSNAIAGIAGVGSILATVAVMFANTATSYLLPVLIEADPKEHGRLSRSAFNKVLHAMILFAAFIPASVYVKKDDISGQLDVVGLTYFVIAALSLLSPVVVPWTARGQIWKGTIFTGVVISVVTLILVGCGLAKLPVEIPLAGALVFVAASVGWVLQDTGVIPYSRPVAVAGTVGFSGLAIAYSFAVDRFASTGMTISMAVVGCVYGLWAVRGPLGRRLSRGKG
ncbi:MAG: hypothetical protein IT363_15420 [Methanoregulaceae archaeon]|nr:hypothetical protein [Methanoregulaceae archaeon]